MGRHTRFQMSGLFCDYVIVWALLRITVRSVFMCELWPGQGEEEGSGEGRAVEEAGGAEAGRLHTVPEQQSPTSECAEQQQQQ